MDMQVDGKLIKAERERRAWSQEHLAEATGLGLRTIQRIEKTGAASYESARALAAVFGVDVARLRAPVAAQSGRLRIPVPLRPALGVLAAVLVAGALFVTSRSLAEQVLLDVGVRLDDTREFKTQMLVEDGSLVPNVNDLRLEQLRFSIVPTIQPDRRILLAVKIFERRGDDDVLVSQPRLIADDGKEAGIALTTEGGRSVRFSITARRQPQLERLPKELHEWR
jgi:transcriptional regulator with XRE-family HTH domain